MTAAKLTKHTCCNVKDAQGQLIHVGDKIVRVQSDTGLAGEIGWVHDASIPDERGVRIRISDNQHEQAIGDFTWSSWTKPEQVRVIESIEVKA